MPLCGPRPLLSVFLHSIVCLIAPLIKGSSLEESRKPWFSSLDAISLASGLSGFLFAQLRMRSPTEQWTRLYSWARYEQSVPFPAPGAPGVC